MAMCTYSQPTALRSTPAASRRRGVVVLAHPVTDALAGTALDASELLDIDVDQLAWPGSLVALGGLQAQPAELAHPDRGQDPRDRRERHAQRVGDLGAGQPQPAQRRDRLDTALVGAVGHDRGRRGTVGQPALALGAIAGQPLAR